MELILLPIIITLIDKIVFGVEIDFLIDKLFSKVLFAKSFSGFFRINHALFKLFDTVGVTESVGPIRLVTQNQYRNFTLKNDTQAHTHRHIECININFPLLA